MSYPNDITDPNWVDITHTVKASESAGRRLVKHLVTGDTLWLDPEDEQVPVPPNPPAMEQQDIPDFLKLPAESPIVQIEEPAVPVNKTEQRVEDRGHRPNRRKAKEKDDGKA